MRHGDKINNLSRTTAHRKALLKNLACQLIQYKRINTTLAKAKALRVYVEPLITKAKNDSTHNRRLVFQKLQDKAAITELFGAISNKVADRPGGYTRIIKLQARLGDAADMAMIELVDFNSLYNLKEEAGGAKKTRRKRSSSKGKAAVATAAAATETVEATATPEAADTAEAVVTAPATDAPAATEAADDLTKIEGIGPKSAEAFQAAGISSFAALAGKTAEELKAVLDAAEGNFGAMDPTTWPQQAQLAADGKWEELKSLQDELKGGRAE